MFKKTKSVDSICDSFKSLINDLHEIQLDNEIQAKEHNDRIDEAIKAREAALAEAKRASEVKFRIQALIGE